jgi:hypothetical protein
MAGGRGMGALQLRVGVLLSRVLKNKMISETSTKTGPVMVAKGGMKGGMAKKNDGRWRHDEEGLCCWWCC